jgi:hypothetical protein
MQKSFERLFVFDVESIGLHGEGYAAAYVVMDKQGRELESGLFAGDPSTAMGDDLVLTQLCRI